MPNRPVKLTSERISWWVVKLVAGLAVLAALLVFFEAKHPASIFGRSEPDQRSPSRHLTEITILPSSSLMHCEDPTWHQEVKAYLMVCRDGDNRDVLKFDTDGNYSEVTVKVGYQGAQKLKPSPTPPLPYGAYGSAYNSYP